MRGSRTIALWLLLGATACPGDPPELNIDSAADSDSGTAGAGTTEGPGTADETSAAASTAATSDATGSSDSGSTGDRPACNGPVSCGGTTYLCGDGLDNDGDGLVDLQDPECLSPCDDDESVFPTGLPDQFPDCTADCGWDGNSGHGDDGCDFDLSCDPLGPGANLGCASSGDCAPTPTAQCLQYCQPLTPPGCDCFGCCEVQSPKGTLMWIFVESSPDCALDNLDACLECTPHVAECGQTCDARACQWCFGQPQPPTGCDPSCADGRPACECHSDCAESEYCRLGCCVPSPRG